MPKLSRLTFTPALVEGDIPNCPYCHSPIRPGEHVVHCPACGAYHHADCWQSNDDHCAVFGCKGRGTLAVEEPSPDLAPATKDVAPSAPLPNSGLFDSSPIQPATPPPEIEFLPDSLPSFGDSALEDEYSALAAIPDNGLPLLEISDEDLRPPPLRSMDIEILSIEPLPLDEWLPSVTTPVPTSAPVAPAQPAATPSAPAFDSGAPGGAKKPNTFGEKVRDLWNRFVAWFSGN